MVDDERKSLAEFDRSRADGESDPLGREVLDRRDGFVRLAFRFLWNRADAEDAVQEAFVCAQRSRDQVRDPARWWSWMARIVVNQCHQALRRRRQDRVHEHKADLPARQDRTIETAELAGLLKGLIGELPDQQRTAVVLRYLEQKEYSEIAKVMEVSESTVRVHVFSGREALREMILKRYPEWAGLE